MFVAVTTNVNTARIPFPPQSLVMKAMSLTKQHNVQRHVRHGDDYDYVVTGCMKQGDLLQPPGACA